MLSVHDKKEEMQFLIEQVFQLGAAWEQSDHFADYSDDLAIAIIGEADRFAKEELAPINRNGDEEGCQLTAEGVKTPKGFVDAWRGLAEGGWCSMAAAAEFGGQAMPKSLSVLVDEIFYAQNSALMLYSTLSVGAVLALETHASAELKNKFIPPIVEGRWAGVMDLTEPHAGSDLGALKTKAQPLDDGSFNLTGSKMFITGGDQDMCENIIHLVLARTPDAPAGHRGISLFLVPKYKVDDTGLLGEANGVSVGSIEHKMGLNGSATCVVNFDDAHGYLVGELNQGLAAMFTMMNYERLSIGIQGLASGQASYDAAMDYALERQQGRSAITGQPCAIIEHADVARMLMTQRVMTEAGRALAIYAAKHLDHAKAANCAESAARAALLTPLVKAFLTDIGLDLTVVGQQVFGGHGYVREWGQEQWVRDARIAQIYEGTNGIQAQDLLKRKVAPDNAQTLFSMLDEQATSVDSVLFSEKVDAFKALTLQLVNDMASDPLLEGAVSCDYLHALGYLEYLFFCELMAKSAETTHLAKHKTANLAFYQARLLPKFDALVASVSAGTAGLIA